jgi:hypothetical protein
MLRIDLQPEEAGMPGFRWTIAPLALLTMSACVSQDCANVYDGHYAGRPQHKAIAMGGGTCFSVWGRADQEAAKRDAVQNCMRAGGSSCSVVAVDGQYTGMTIRESEQITGAINDVLTVAGAVATGYVAARGGASMPYATPSPGQPSPMNTGQQASCSAEDRALRMEMQNLQARMQSGSEGICSMSRHSERLFTRLAALHRRCASVMPDAHAQAAAYDRHAASARQTARSSCSS